MIPDRTWEKMLLALTSQTPIYLQRLPHRISANEVVERCQQQGWAVRLVTSPFEQAELRILDCRQKNQEWFEGADAQRERIVAAGRLLVLLDVHASNMLQQKAPNLTSWAGGIWLPGESGVVVASTDAQNDLGERLLKKELSERQIKPVGEVAIDLATRRIFIGTSRISAEDLAQESLDEGLLYVEWFDA